MPHDDEIDVRNLAAVRRAALEALGRTGEYARCLDLGGMTLRLRFAGTNLTDKFLAALAGKEASPGPTDLDVIVWDSAGTGVSFPDLEPGRRTVAGRRGGDQRVEKVFQRGLDTFTAIDHYSRHAVVWVPDAAGVTTNEIACPLRMLIHLWGRRQGLHLLHGGAVGASNGGVLVAGRSGIGKSTAALACLGTDLRYAGDDYVLVEAGPSPYAHAVYTSGKLQPDQLQHFAHLAPARINSDGDDKPVFLFAQTHSHCLTSGFPLRAIVVPRVTGTSDPRLVRASAAAAVANLAPSTVFQLPYSGLSTLAVASELARRLPTYYLEVGDRISRVPRLLSEWIGGCDA